MRGRAPSWLSTDSEPGSLVSGLCAVPLQGCAFVALPDASVSLPQRPFGNMHLPRQAPVKRTRLTSYEGPQW